MNHNHLRVFSGRANRPLAERIARNLGDSLGNLRVESFPDSETSVRIEEDVRGRDVFIVQPTCPPVNENLMELLVILDAFKRASPARVTVVLPYYGYARQDRKDQGRVPISAKLAANLLTAAGANRVLTMDLHAAQIQGFFDIPVDHLMAVPVFIQHIRQSGLMDQNVVFVSPDEGRVKMTLEYQKKLGGELSIVDKRRSSPTETEQANLIGASLEGKVAIMFDDMITTAGSICGAAQVCKMKGAREIHVFATHGVLCGAAIHRLREAPIERICITDSIPLPAEKAIPKITVLSIDYLLADAIRRIHDNESISALIRSV
ncbi:ribose-phosphate pyrophosphokinase [Telmatocola sphagniphila]|jgi:ribose-phosphate pyrophosphokinase|uniref:Ribose-phosphate pyrophosphokinase n=1 Tax=Telmatocola sphagniphila TaxID=1123043 RepID=A0A8E6B363_9BACT|nr:ribose-phosphate pyrophosphokinase [Telmatocola sphagniphila]QVL31093.1 ribose-phosphate pyrophosphokinase [Telmatocola sphagniphila]